MLGAFANGDRAGGFDDRARQYPVNSPSSKILQLREHWLSTPGPYFTASVAGAGAAASAGAADILHPGTLQCTTGTTATGRVNVGNAIAGGNSISFSPGFPVGFESIFKIDQLSTVGDEFATYSGYGDALTYLQTDGFGIEYDRLLQGVNWQFVSSANSIRTRLNSGIVATAAQWVRFAMILNLAGNSIDCYYNDARIGSIATNIPNGTARAMGIQPAVILKSAGLNPVTVTHDSFDAEIRLAV